MSDTAAPPLSRRAFVLSIAATGAAGATTLGAAGSIERAAQRAAREVSRVTGVPLPGASLAYGMYEDWLREVGSIFATRSGFSLRLAAVTPVASPGQRPRSVARSRGFIAAFEVVGGRAIPAGQIHAISHSRYGWMEIYLTPPGNARSGARVTALFN